MKRYFAQLDQDNTVIRCITVDSEDCKKKAFWDPLGLFSGKRESEAVGIAFCQNHINDSSSVWKQTGEQVGWGSGFRGNMAGIGHTYMTNVRTLGVASTDIFIKKCSFPSWSIGINTARWYPPDNPGIAPEFTEEEQKDVTLHYLWNESNYQADPSTAWVLTRLYSPCEESIEQIEKKLGIVDS